MNHLAAPHVRDAGSGPGVVCLHSNASRSSQWRSLMDRLAPHYRVLAPDSLGAGRALALRDEVARLEPVFAAAGGPCFVVGHAHGAAVALMAAMARPERVRALVLCEPALFALLEQEMPPHDDAMLDVPVLYLLGAHSPASSRGVARLLTQTLSNVSVIEFADLGHSGPSAHAELVNDAIESFLSCH